MATWKERGEVPDSDDESAFDSNHESDHEPQHQNSSAGNRDQLAANSTAPEDQDVWDIPRSSQCSGKERETFRGSTRPILQALPESNIGTRNVDISSPLSSLEEPRDQPGNSTQTVEHIEEAEAGAEEPTQGFQAKVPTQFIDEIVDVEDFWDGNEASSRQDVLRIARSLRPRKPIQEHPYLLENAQYSKVLKSHGMRPIRVHAAEIARRQEEDSQEQEYEDESQSTSKDITQGESEESQGIGRLDPLDDVEEITPSLVGNLSPSPRRRPIQVEISLRSSQDDEELPDPAEIDKWRPRKRPENIAKRRASPKIPGRQKFAKVHHSDRSTRGFSPAAIHNDVFEIPPSPPQTSPTVLGLTPVTAIRRSEPMTTITPRPSSTISSRNQSPVPTDHSTNVIDLTRVEDEDGTSDGQATDTSSGSESESEAVRAAVRRIRGVLPASWLRLDQQSTHKNSKKVHPQQSPDRSPERSHRKGVAQRRHVSPRPANDTALFLDDSDDDNMASRFDDFNELVPGDDAVPLFEDDADSVVEEDHIDRMLPGRKRATMDANESERPRKRKKNQQSIFGGRPGQPRRQQRITGLLSRTKGTSVKPTVPRHHTGSSISTGRLMNESTGRRAKTLPPPRLSILDVVEPNAPDFIRIAARTANKRPDRGRSSPSQKRIALGTRKDNIDAIGILRNWKKGTIQPKIPTATAANVSTNVSEPLKPIPNNHVTHPPETRLKRRPRRIIHSSLFSQSRRMVKQASIDKFITVEDETQSTPDNLNYTTSPLNQAPIGRTRPNHAASRPAQLETEGEKVSRYAFDARKRALDALYRKSRKTLSAPANVGLERLVGTNVPQKSTPQQFQRPSLENRPPSPDRPQIPDSRVTQKRSKFRKQFRPQHVNVTAPQYAHANDPVPREPSPAYSIAIPSNISEDTGKLLGLGPFGTHYTQHFEVFPLEPGVFFHESTFVGSGRLSKSLEEKSLNNLHCPRGRRTFVLDEKTLLWGQWDAQTSSELGIVFDWIIEYFHTDSSDVTRYTRTTVQASEFILDYLQDSISFLEQESEKHFASRALEILQSFTQRLEALPFRGHQTRPLIDVSSRSLVIVFQTLRICQKLNQISESFELEEVLKRIAKVTIRRLLDTGLEDVQSLYNELQRMPFRERGIRDEQYSIICWITIIRVLEEAHIPRSGFWDVASSVMLSTDTSTLNDAHAFEKIWCNLFTILPLGEFDSAGVIVSGIRHTIPLEGWSLPQSLLKRVFQLYESNSRQSPSFNDYCRGIVSRCHYLVEQWGWRKCNGIIGTIFDFFAARNLSHLRNEEAYRSPEFLEHLAGTPSLAISPEDRCFQIFLKLLALSIQCLKRFGLTKDVRNLVARVLPNHNRQYDKEKDIHETELAALRNHHDLLCTLFWAAPPELRPSVQIIEKLVMAGRSHKEACLISLRAWSQLARFIISSDNDNATYKPFADWQRNVFQQVMEQYLSAESDVHQQLLRMSKDASKSISRDMMNAVVKMNRKSAMDVLHFSMKAFLDVMQHAPTLGAASFALNHYQLEQVFTRFPFSSADFDWSGLRAGLDILDHYVTRIEEFLIQGPADADHSWHGEDAIILLDRKMAAPFFSMAQTITGIDFKEITLGPTSDRAISIEQAVSLAGRQAARLIHARLLRVSHFFETGKYSMFGDTSKAVSSPARKYRSLFLAILVEQDIDNFKDLGATILDLFLVEVVKPFEFLAYENRFAQAIKRHGEPYLKDAVIEIGNSPDYNSNRSLFSHTIAAMRKMLRSAEASRKQQLQVQFSKCLRTTMDRMKLDLRSITRDTPEHANHIEFVRSIITLIRSQDLCPVDSFFYQISREYSPSSQDPRLQIASILSWGLKLEEGDTKAIPGLFYLLFSNFKLALANGKLMDEKAILEKGMGNSHVFSYIASRIFPAITKAAVQVPEGWVLLDTYVDAFDALLSAPCIHGAIEGDDVTGLITLLNYILVGVQHLAALDIAELRPEHLHTLTQIIRLLNLVSPSLTAYLLNDSASQTAADIIERIEAFTNFTRAADEYLSGLIDDSKHPSGFDSTGQAFTVNPNRLFEGVRAIRADLFSDRNEHIDRFTKHMVQDIKDNWVSNESAITVRGPSKPSQSGQGTPIQRWNARELAENLDEQLQVWNHANDAAATTTMTMMRRDNNMSFEDYLF
ncbi:Mus7/MMS22 family-domain-containing protein [Xylariaceae sp. FL0662B]|nr:Mus7/MMS22 family-domain-containing protein [Xylariaceae sp. FL0662B]